jgi:hypothetical protein
MEKNGNLMRMSSKRKGRKRKRGRRKNPKEGLLMGRGLHKKTVELIDFIKENILKDDRKSIRRIYYALEARQMLESSDEAYQKVIYTMKMARFHGLIHPEQLLLDKARVSWSHVRESKSAKYVIDGLDWAGYGYQVNYWDIIDTYIEVWQEKEGMEPEFMPITKAYNIRLETGRGDQSITAIWNAMKRWDLFLSGDKRIVVLYFGDFNPSGLHAPIAIQNTVAKLRNAWKDEFNGDFSKIEFKRVALTLENVKKFIEEFVDEDVRAKAEARTDKVVARLNKIVKTMKKEYFEKHFEKKKEDEDGLKK